MRLFGLIERMSRRDLPTQVWLIEERVRRDDIAGALRHYDIALRTGPEASERLFPVLIAATANDGIVGPLTALLRTDPPWRTSYLFTLAQAPPSGRNALRIVQGLISARLAIRPDIMATLTDSVARARDFDSARRLYQLARPGNAGAWSATAASPARSPSRPSNGRWWRGRFDGRTIQFGRAGDGNVSKCVRRAAQAAIVTQQMLVLAPGRYRIGERSGPLAETRPVELYWRIVCVNRSNTVIADVPIARSRPAGAAAPAWQVPASDCAAQLLTLAVRPGAAADAGACFMRSR